MNTSIELTPAMLAIIPVIAYFINVLKGIIEPYKWYDRAKRFLPVIAILFGVGLSYLFQIDNPTVSGILTGIVSVGGYEILKARPEVKP